MISSTLFAMLLCFFGCATARDGGLEIRAGCSSTYSKCSPKGAATTDEPAVGSALSGMFADLLGSIKGNENHARATEQDGATLHGRGVGGSLCCADGTQCLLLQNLDLPFCYDNYTTNYFLPGGAYGQVVSGDYTASDGSRANLISGRFTLHDDTSGNIYGSGATPDTAALTLPTQYTASGSGSAIPVTALGEEVTYTTTIPGTTIPPSAVAAVVIPPSVVSGSTLSPGTTKPATTMAGTTIAPQTSTVTTRLPKTQATKTGGANGVSAKRCKVGTIAVIGTYVMLLLCM